MHNNLHNNCTQQQRRWCVHHIWGLKAPGLTAQVPGFPALISTVTSCLENLFYLNVQVFQGLWLQGIFKRCILSLEHLSWGISSSQRYWASSQEILKSSCSISFLHNLSLLLHDSSFSVLPFPTKSLKFLVYWLCCRASTFGTGCFFFFRMSQMCQEHRNGSKKSSTVGMCKGVIFYEYQWVDGRFGGETRGSFIFSQESHWTNSQRTQTSTLCSMKIQTGVYSHLLSSRSTWAMEQTLPKYSIRWNKVVVCCPTFIK